MIRHLRFPKTLFRLQNSLRFRLKQRQEALAKGKLNYDYVANQHGLYMPRNLIQQKQRNFQSNGVQLFTMGENFKDILRSSIKGSLRYYYVIEIPQGTQLPQKTVLLQDPIEDYVYWLETSEPVQAKEFNSKIELLLLGNKIHRKKQFKPLIVSQITKKHEKIITNDQFQTLESSSTPDSNQKSI